MSQLLKPSALRRAVRLLFAAKLVPFIWGGAGISKSANTLVLANTTESTQRREYLMRTRRAALKRELLATNPDISAEALEKNLDSVTVSSSECLGVAAVDVRLSMYAPTDVQGMPYRIEENGRTVGVAFTPPKILPRNLDYETVLPIDAVVKRVRFNNINPTGVNGIHYCQNPIIEVSAVNPAGTAPESFLTAEILDEGLDHFDVRLVNPKGELCDGRVQYKITGIAEAIVAFEELNSAPLATQQAAYQFILDRRVGEYIVPELVVLIALGNRDTDKGLTYKMPLPLENRFIHLELNPDFTEWQNWAVEEGFNAVVMGFLAQGNGGKLNSSQSDLARKTGRGFRTPRSWTFLSTAMNTNDSLGMIQTTISRQVDGNGTEIMMSNEMRAIACGCVGDADGLEFAAHAALAHALPDCRKVYSGETKTIDAEFRDNIAIQFTLTTQLCYYLRAVHKELLEEGVDHKSTAEPRVEFYRGFNNVLKFWMDNFNRDVCVMAMRTALKIHGLPVFNRDALSHLPEFTKRFGKFLSAQDE